MYIKNSNNNKWDPRTPGIELIKPGITDSLSAQI